MMKIRLTKNDNTPCPRINKYVHVSECKLCQDCFGVVDNRYINCKRGNKTDNYLKKSEHIYEKD